MTTGTRPATTASAEDLVLLGVEHGDLGAAPARLSPELRAVIQATVLDGLTVGEASQLLRVPMARSRRAPCAQRRNCGGIWHEYDLARPRRPTGRLPVRPARPGPGDVGGGAPERLRPVPGGVSRRRRLARPAVARPSRSGWRVRPPRFGPPPSPSCRLTTSATARCAFWSLMRVAIALVRPRPGRHPVRAAGRLAVPPGRPVPMARPRRPAVGRRRPHRLAARRTGHAGGPRDRPP
jgi:hypothetical protein